MKRKVFFSFHYERDSWRAGQVRNSGRIGRDIDYEGFIDKAQWEEIKNGGEQAIKRWIDTQMHGTSVTVVLIGKETNTREWVIHELKKSAERGNGIVGVYIHNIKDSKGETDLAGSNSFGQIFKDKNGNPKFFFELYKTYDWVTNNGYANLTTRIEEAARNAGK